MPSLPVGLGFSQLNAGRSPGWGLLGSPPTNWTSDSVRLKLTTHPLYNHKMSSKRVYSRKSRPSRSNEIPKGQSELILVLNTTEKDVDDRLQTMYPIKVGKEATQNQTSQAHPPSRGRVQQRNKMLQSRKRKESADSDGEPEHPTPMPEFISAARMGTYPKRTNIKCRHCTLRFDTVPLMMPLRIEEDGRVKAFGCFCSTSCLYGHIIYRLQEPMLEVILSLTNWVLENLFQGLGLSLENINPIEPGTELLVEFGGTMTREQLKAMIKGTEIQAMVLQPPIYAEVPQIIRVDANFLTPIESASSYLHSSIDNIGRIISNDLKNSSGLVYANNVRRRALRNADISL